MSKLHPVSRQWLAICLTAIFSGLLILPTMSRSQQPTREQQVKELEKQLADLQKKLNDLKQPETNKQKAIWLDDIPKWGGLHGTSLSPDGQWFAFRTGPAEGNAEVTVRQTKGDKEYKFAVGQSTAGALTFSNDSKWIAFPINAAKGGKGGGGKGGPPAGGGGEAKVALLNLATGTKVDLEGFRAFKFSGDAATHLALQRTGGGGGGKGGAKGGGGPGPKGGAGTAPVTNGSAGGDLVLYELATGNQLTFGNVAEYAFDKKGQWLALAVDTKDEYGNGIQLRNMATAAVVPLESAKAVYRGLAWTEKGDGLTVLKGVDDKAQQTKLYSIVAFTDFGSGTPVKIVFDPKTDSSFPAGMTISPSRVPTWTEDMSAVTFAIHKITKDEEKKDTPEKAQAPVPPGKGAGKKGGKGAGLTPGGAKDKPDLVIWHWADERLQSQQQVQQAQDKNINYVAVYRPVDKKFIRLADDKLRQVVPANKARWAIAQDTKPYQLMSTLDGRKYQDIYVIDMQSGERKKVLTKNRWYSGTSPDGTHFLYYDDGHFFTYEMATGKSYKITADVPTSFINQEDDHNVVKPPSRSLGWSKDSAFVLLSDEWDVWKVPVHGGSALNLTVNGKKDSIRYTSRIALDLTEKGIDLNAPVYFSFLGEWTKKAGVGRVEPGKTGVTRLLWDDADFKAVQKAKNADVFVYTRETYKDYPDCYVTDASFQNGKKLTNANPGQEKYLWSSGVKLIDYTSAKGDKLQAALFLPANYEKGKSYPTIVYIYEKLSNGLNHYQGPAANGFNKALYTSNGYAVLMPDIKYKVNDPGRSAVWCVLPALDAAVATGVVDRNKVGLHGHSWGGYETAFLVTQTDVFKAAVAGAPLTDMVSMYSSIYWNTGTANQPIFESSQGRFTGGYWEDLDAYIRNSPVHYAKNVKTPLIILHNDKDGAVDWNQGIEYFNTLRRLQKPVVLLQYKGENHSLAKAANKRDYTIRMREFFDHYLMGKPAPAWLTDGVPHLKLDDHITERMKSAAGGN